MAFPVLLNEIAQAATAIGALFAGWQLLLVNRQATTQFEDQLSAQYREIIRKAAHRSHDGYIAERGATPSSVAGVLSLLRFVQ
jgi:hypothetical protein